MNVKRNDVPLVDRMNYYSYDEQESIGIGVFIGADDANLGRQAQG